MMDDSPVSPPGAENFVAGSRVTPKELQDAERQIGQNYSALMDSMETSVPAQGEWFVPIGQKTGGRDSRVMLLRDVGERPATKEEKARYSNAGDGEFNLKVFTFVTDKGIMLYNIKEGYSSEPILRGVLSGKDEVDEAAGGSVQEEDGDGLNMRMVKTDKSVRYADNIHRIPFSQMNPYEGDEVDFGEKVKRSIEKAGESAAAQNRRKLAELQKKAEMPKNLANMISSLPPQQ